MISQVCTAVDAAVATVTGVQIGLESFGLGLLHHVFEEHTQTKTMSDHICKDLKKSPAAPSRLNLTMKAVQSNFDCQNSSWRGCQIVLRS